MEGYKTYFFGVVSILFAVFGVMLGKMEPTEGFNIIQIAIASIFLRRGIENK